jgi:glucose/arabinose dehydrogenase
MLLVSLIAPVLIFSSAMRVSGRSYAVLAPPRFVIETVAAGLDAPTAIAWASDGRMFIALKNGRVRVMQDGVLLAKDFIDLSSQVNHYWDRGLLGLAVHPAFPATPYVYLLYVYDPPGVPADGIGARVSRLIRVSADPNDTNVALPGSEVVILGQGSTRDNIGDVDTTYDTAHSSCEFAGAIVEDCIPADSSNHSVGALAFGPDGSLFVGNGDNAVWEFADPRALRALNLDSPSGKVLRINPITGEGYGDNPFFDGDSHHNRSKVWSYGLRNPFRFAIHPTTGQLYIADVGFKNWEEIDVGRGANFGWPCYEGNDRHALFELDPATGPACAALYARGSEAVGRPLFAYSHEERDASVTAAAFYSGASYPLEYRNALFIADYSQDWIKYLSFDSAGQATPHDFASDVSVDFAGPVQLIIGPDTNLYYVMLDPFGKNGEVRRIRYVGGGNAPPAAELNAMPTDGGVPLTVMFSGEGSRDPDAQALSFLWQFGDGVTSTLKNAMYTYHVTGTYTATLTVTDTLGAASSANVVVTAGNHRPVVTVTLPASGTLYAVGDIIHFNGSASDVEDSVFGGIQPISMTWGAVLHHGEHVHPNFVSSVGPSGSFEAIDHGDNTWIELCLTATDSGGLSNMACRSLLPNLVPFTIHTEPPGLSLIYDGTKRTTPFTAYSVVGSKRQLSAPLHQDGCWFKPTAEFNAQTISVQIGVAPGSRTARYECGGSSVWLPMVTQAAPAYPR